MMAIVIIGTVSASVGHRHPPGYVCVLYIYIYIHTYVCIYIYMAVV